MALVDRGALLLPVTAGSVVLAYNLPGIQGDLKLSRAAYAGIFLGEIKNWNDPAIARTNPGVKLPRLTIATVVRQDRSGTTFAFTNHLSAVSEKWRSALRRSHLRQLAGQRHAGDRKRRRRRPHRSIDRLHRLRGL